MGKVDEAQNAIDHRVADSDQRILSSDGNAGKQVRKNCIPHGEKLPSFSVGRDQMSVGFRSTKDGSRPNELDDFFFYPPTDESASGLRAMRFSVPKKLANLCIAFTFVSYSPLAANGKVTITELRLKKIESSNYKFTDSALPLKDKANVKALMLDFSVTRNGEEGVDSLIIRIPSNGRNG